VVQGVDAMLVLPLFSRSQDAADHNCKTMIVKGMRYSRHVQKLFLFFPQLTKKWADT
jgi:hypothetical protein